MALQITCSEAHPLAYMQASPEAPRHEEHQQAEPLGQAIENGACVEVLKCSCSHLPGMLLVEQRVQGAQPILGFSCRAAIIA